MHYCIQRLTVCSPVCFYVFCLFQPSMSSFLRSPPPSELDELFSLVQHHHADAHPDLAHTDSSPKYASRPPSSAPVLRWSTCVDTPDWACMKEQKCNCIGVDGTPLACVDGAIQNYTLMFAAGTRSATARADVPRTPDPICVCSPFSACSADLAPSFDPFSLLTRTHSSSLLLVDRCYSCASMAELTSAPLTSECSDSFIAPACCLL